MDLLSQRYASPFLIMDEFIRLQQFHDFVYEVLKRIADEKAYKARWEYYLHRVFDISFEEYERRCKMPKQSTEYMTNQEVSNVVNASKELLKGFVPE
jgi:hypothetical protein